MMGFQPLPGRFRGGLNISAERGPLFFSVGPCQGPAAANFAHFCLEQALFAPFFSQTFPQNPVQLTN